MSESSFRYLNIYPIFTDKWPPYASHLIFEIVTRTDNNNQKFVRAIYNHKPIKMNNSDEIWSVYNDIL